MGTRARGLGRGRLEGAKAGKSLLIDWVGRVQWGPRLCRRWERSGVGASMEDLARALCQGWWAREDFQVVYGQVSANGSAVVAGWGGADYRSRMGTGGWYWAGAESGGWGQS